MHTINMYTILNELYPLMHTAQMKVMLITVENILNVIIEQGKNITYIVASTDISNWI